MADTSRWQRFPFRTDDVVITTPTKCGTTWTQQIVALLTLDSDELDVPLTQISPWLDTTIDTDQAVFGLLAAQRHRRIIKTHSPLDGIPFHSSVTYIAVVRHPLDVALSRRDHAGNLNVDQIVALRSAATGEFTPADEDVPPSDDAAGYLRWWIHNDLPPDGNGPRGLADFCHQARTYWARRGEPNVHLLHYRDLHANLSGEIAILADTLGVEPDATRLAYVADAASLDAMRKKAGSAVPFADRGIWQSNEAFFTQGGERDWSSILNADDLDHFHRRGLELAGQAWPWVVNGRSALDGYGRQTVGVGPRRGSSTS
jgi:aryl sulfotransferase